MWYLTEGSFLIYSFFLFSFFFKRFFSFFLVEIQFSEIFSLMAMEKCTFLELVELLGVLESGLPAFFIIFNPFNLFF